MNIIILLQFLSKNVFNPVSIGIQLNFIKHKILMISILKKIFQYFFSPL
jgi:hypothetical protein